MRLHSFPIAPEPCHALCGSRAADSPGQYLQGTKDYVVDISAGQHLHKLAKRPAKPYWAEGRDHENVELSQGYVPHLRRFLETIFGQNYG